MKKNIFNITYWKSLKTEQISMRIFYAMVCVAVLIFGLFFLVGYNMPFLSEPEYNAPLFTDAVMWFVYLMLVAATAVAVVALVKGYKKRQTERVVNGVPAARVAWGTVALLVVLLVVTFLLGGSSPVRINGKMFSEVFWLKLTDMFINTTFVLLVLAAAAVVFSLSGMNRKWKK